MDVVTNTLQSPLPTPTATGLPPVNGGANSISLWFVIGGGFLVLALAILLYQFFKKEQGYPLEKELESVLMPHLFALILGAFEEATEGLDVVEGRIENLDKVELAERIYGLLPNKIADYDTSLIKTIFTEEQFEQMFLNAYEQVREYYLERKGDFVNLFEDKYQ